MEQATLDAMMSSDRQDWATPPPFLEWLAERFGFEPDLDPAAAAHNTKAPHYFTEAQNGLFQNWFGKVWINPPFGAALPTWIDKCILESQRDEVECVFCLIPARTDTKYFHEKIARHASYIYFVKGRFEFRFDSEIKNPKGCALFPSMLVIFDKNYLQTEMRTLYVPLSARRWD